MLFHAITIVTVTNSSIITITNVFVIKKTYFTAAVVIKLKLLLLSL